MHVGRGRAGSDRASARPTVIVAVRDGSCRDPRVVATIVESILARSYAFVVSACDTIIVGGWAAAVVLAIMFLPPLSATSSGGLSNLIPPGLGRRPRRSRRGAAVRLPHRLGRAIVQRDRTECPPVVRDRAIRQAIAVDRRLSGRSEGQLATPRRHWPGRPSEAARTPVRPGQPGAAGWHSRASRGVPAAQTRPACLRRDERAVHHGQSRSWPSAGHLVRRAGGRRERLHALVPQPA